MYAYSDEERDRLLPKEEKSIEELLQESANEENNSETEEGEEEPEEDVKTKKPSNKIHVQRYKGLGVMNSEELWDTSMDPEKRTLLQIRMEDAAAADEIFRVLMGDAVEPRREFIEKHALDVKELDI